MRRRAINNVISILIGLLLALMACAMISCTSVKYVPIETIRTDTMHHYVMHYDSIVKWDSIFIDRYVNGDTVMITKEVYRNRYRDKVVHDTLYINKVDSIQVPMPIERKLTKWQEFKINAGEWLLGGIVTILVVFAVLWVIKLKRNKV